MGTRATAVRLTAALGAIGFAMVAGACGDDDGPADADAGSPDATAFEPYPPGAPAVSWFRPVPGEGGIVAHHQPIPDDMSTHLSGNGAAVGDVDGDGLPDVITTVGGGPATLFANRGGLAFEDVSAAAGFDADFDVLSAALADLDRDGDLDCVLGGAPGAGGDGSLRLLENDGAGAFADVTADAGFATTAAVHGVLVHDFDGDGLVDVYACLIGSTRAGTGDRLYRNRGDGTFEDVTARAGLIDGGYCWTAAGVDYDGDGDADLYVANDEFIEDTGARPVPPGPDETFPDFLYRNDGPDADGYVTFTEVGAASAAVIEPRSTMGIIVADFDGDELTDLYLSDFGRNELLLGDGGGDFSDATTEYGLELTARVDSGCAPAQEDCLLVSWGSALTDFDLDGYDDLVVANSLTAFGVDKRQPVGLFRGGPAGLEPVQTQLGWLAGRALVAADLDADGDLDLVLTTWEGPVRLFENISDEVASADDFVRVRLAGASGGIGAQVRLTLDDGRTLVRHVGFGGSVHSWNAADVHFGLGGATVTAAEVRWASGFWQTFDVTPGTLVEVVEPALVDVQPASAPADGSSTVEVIVTPAAADGSPLGAGHTVEVTASAGSWQTPVADAGDGSYRGTLTAPGAPALSVLRVTIDGATLDLLPRVEFR